MAPTDMAWGSMEAWNHGLVLLLAWGPRIACGESWQAEGTCGWRVSLGCLAPEVTLQCPCSTDTSNLICVVLRTWLRF